MNIKHSTFLNRWQSILPTLISTIKIWKSHSLANMTHWGSRVCHYPFHYEYHKFNLSQYNLICNWLSLRCLVPWINHLPPVCWSTFGILVWNDSVYVNLTQWWYFFIIFEYILHISTPHIMVFCFPLPYFPLSTSALFFAKYSCTHIVYRRSLVTFY